MLGTIPSAYLFPEVLPAYVKCHPATYFTIEQGDSRSVTEKVAEGVIDIGLIGMKPASPDIEAEPFCEDTVVIITPVREPFLTRKENGAATLKSLVFSFPEIPVSRRFYLATKKSGNLPECAVSFLRFLRRYYAG